MIPASQGVSSDVSGRMEEPARQALTACYQCGTCTAVCPMGVPVRSMMRGAQMGMRIRSVEEVRLWSCATCKLCELTCPRGVSIVDVVHSLRVMGSESKKVPPKLESAMWGVYEEGNPWGGVKQTRGKWAQDIKVKDALSEKVDYLLYVGCAASFDSRLQSVARSLVKVLDAAGTSFGVLGNSENCCGDVVYQTGEEGFLEELVTGNVATFKKTGAQNVVSISPHCHNMFKSVYPKFGSDIRAVHYTELLAELVDNGKLKMGPAEDGKMSVTYHDPCYLGRYHGVYEQPRKVLESVPGIELVEMDEAKENALCCGGGGGQMWLDVVGERPSQRRVSQAAQTGASKLVSSCPYCIQNFEDGVKIKGLSGLGVVDLTEVLADRVVRSAL